MQVSPLMSPLVWDFAHIGYFEELWLLRELGGEPPVRAEHDDVYDAFAHERSERGELPMLPPQAARAYVADVRAPRAGAAGGRQPGRRGSAARRRVPVRSDRPARAAARRDDDADAASSAACPARSRSGRRRSRRSGEVLVEAGPFTLGADEDAVWAYDNELPRARGDAAGVPDRPRRSSQTPTGWPSSPPAGTRTATVWSDEGWEWREAEQADAPLYWERDGDDWLLRRFDRVEPVPPRRAGAARLAGTRPTPTRAGPASGCRPRRSGRRRRALPATSSSTLQGAVWQWTSLVLRRLSRASAPFPYAEYSEVFFGEEYRMLRGGSWITDPVVARTSFRNWDYPQRRQIFSGVRCAADA